MANNAQQQAMAPKPTSMNKLLDEISNQEQAPLLIHFPDTTVTKPGTKLSKATAKPSPTLSIGSPALAGKPAETKYLAIALDPDAPFTSFSFLSPILHGLQTDLVAAGAADAEGWVKLEAEGGKKPLVEWGPPGPPPISSPHKYVFMVWEQPDGMSEAKARGLLGLKEQIGLSTRMKWDQAGCEKKLGLGEVLAGNYFVCG